MRRTKEFDEFGPWVDEVTAAEDVPSLYRDHRLDLASAQLVLKVPRRISRRDANPDMDLYDHLVVAGPQALTVLSRRSSTPGYDVSEVPYSRVASLSTSVELLDGRLTVHDVEAATPGRAAVAFRYNSVSQDAIERLMRIVRRSAQPGGEPAVVDGGSYLDLDLQDLGPHDVALVTAQREVVTHDPQLAVVAVHPRTGVPRRTGTARGLLDVLRPATLHAAVVMVGPDELHVLHRRRWLTTGRRPVHSVAQTVVLVPRVTETVVREDERWSEVQVIQVTSGRSAREIPVPQGSASGEAITRVLGANAAG
ncbi:hypothetical protein [Actinotalea sp. K2]|uniref:hypothetical protein n=1 Tax=Actinotalea sp. K2 TaxID=2939438 RepID=UPI0020171867|nr:hypothetical protein [Actinotalea sp. K2]MCL3861758.1 hypothetical protein [Actinotalea sp. K2]